MKKMSDDMLKYAMKTNNSSGDDNMLNYVMKRNTASGDDNRD